MKTYKVLVAVTRLEELEVKANNYDEVEFDKNAVPCYDKDRETIEILNIEEVYEKINTKGF